MPYLPLNEIMRNNPGAAQQGGTDMSKRLTAVLVGLAILLFLGYSSIFVVNERQQAIVVRFGQIQDVKNVAGPVLQATFAFMDADRVQYVENRALRFDHDNIRVQVSGGKFYEVDASWSIALRMRAASPDGVGRPDVCGIAPAYPSRRLAAPVYGLRGFESALSDARASMMQEVRDDLRPDAESLGISIVDVRIRRTDLTQEVSQQTFERMKSERWPRPN